MSDITKNNLPTDLEGLSALSEEQIEAIVEDDLTDDQATKLALIISARTAVQMFGSEQGVKACFAQPEVQAIVRDIKPEEFPAFWNGLVTAQLIIAQDVSEGIIEGARIQQHLDAVRCVTAWSFVNNDREAPSEADLLEGLITSGRQFLSTASDEDRAAFGERMDRAIMGADQRFAMSDPTPEQYDAYLARRAKTVEAIEELKAEAAA